MQYRPYGEQRRGSEDPLTCQLKPGGGCGQAVLRGMSPLDGDGDGAGDGDGGGEGRRARNLDAVCSTRRRRGLDQETMYAGIMRVSYDGPQPARRKTRRPDSRSRERLSRRPSLSDIPPSGQRPPLCAQCHLEAHPLSNHRAGRPRLLSVAAVLPRRVRMPMTNLRNLCS